MALMRNFIPEVWDARLLHWLGVKFVFGGIVNTDYEGEIKGLGSIVHVNQITGGSISNYTRGVDVVPDGIDSNMTSFQINEAKNWACQVNAMDQAVMPFSTLEANMQKYGYLMASAIDAYGLDVAYDGAGLAYAGSVATIGIADIPKMFASINRQMDEANMQEDGRWVIIPPWLYEKMLLSNIGVMAQNNAILANGVVGSYLGMTLKRSNAIPKANATDFQCVAGAGNDAITYAFKSIETSPYELPLQFERGVKSLFCYGAKVMLPDRLMGVLIKEKSE